MEMILEYVWYTIRMRFLRRAVLVICPKVLYTLQGQHGTEQFLLVKQKMMPQHNVVGHFKWGKKILQYNSIICNVFH